jgi:hypothetical protein
MADETDPTRDAADEEHEMQEHEREARERDPNERGPEGETSTDAEAARPAPPGNAGRGSTTST